MKQNKLTTLFTRASGVFTTLGGAYYMFFNAHFFHTLLAFIVVLLGLSLLSYKPE